MRTGWRSEQQMRKRIIRSGCRVNHSPLSSFVIREVESGKEKGVCRLKLLICRVLLVYCMLRPPVFTVRDENSSIPVSRREKEPSESLAPGLGVLLTYEFHSGVFRSLSSDLISWKWIEQLRPFQLTSCKIEKSDGE